MMNIHTRTYTHSRYTRAFTLIELLVVIAIIGILSAVVLASLGSARDRAMAARIVSDIRQIENAFMLLALEENVSTWWRDVDFGNSGTVPIATIAADTGLGVFLPNPPTPPVGNQYTYDNDNDASNSPGCDDIYSRGVNILVSSFPPAVFTQLDKMVDGGDGALCGKVMTNGTSLTWKLSPTPQMR